MNKCTLAIFCLFLLFAERSFAETILVIQSYHIGYPWDKSYIEGLESELGGKHKIERFEMNTKRIPKSQYQDKANEAWNYYNQVKPDLVILGDDNAMSYLGKKINDAGTPVVFLGVNGNPRELGIDKMEHVTGVLERPLFKRSISEIRRIMGGELGKALILFDSGNTSSTAVAEAFNGKMSSKAAGVTVDIKQVGTEQEWKDVILHSKDNGYNAVIIGLYQTLVDDEQKSVDAEEILAWTSANTPIPSFAFWDFSVGANKAIGGLVLFGKTQGEEAGKIALRILAGDKPNMINPMVGEKGRYLFSKSEVTRWKIQLPGDLLEKAEWVD
ncbi:ABC transporter substrate-binding protein [Hahella sp. KA22]|uniref:ABC transporter substrate-binding protein n=1 Tax=Hahella sp. KA22 TaxID=1628392 RepID=UPI0013E2F1ED|nr:ABC transporter substrate binding protein [Hahella sp. KA22]